MPDIDPDVALFIGMNSIQLNGVANSTADDRENIKNTANWRHLLKDPRNGRPIAPPQQRQQYPQRQQGQQDFGGYSQPPDSYEPPDSDNLAIDVSRIPQLPVPFLRDANGQALVPPSIRNEVQPQPQGLQVGGFSIPNYRDDLANPDTENKLNLILKEIKSLKRLVNKLITQKNDDPKVIVEKEERFQTEKLPEE